MYLHNKGTTAGPRFHFKHGELLTRKRFDVWAKSGLSKAGFDHKDYNSHFFWTGVATTAAPKGMKDSIITTLGQWESTAYLHVRYLT